MLISLHIPDDIKDLGGNDTPHQRKDADPEPMDLSAAIVMRPAHSLISLCNPEGIKDLRGFHTTYHTNARGLVLGKLTPVGPLTATTLTIRSTTTQLHR
jgi:hypothetical protein